MGNIGQTGLKTGDVGAYSLSEMGNIQFKDKDELSEFLFRSFDKNKDGKIDSEEFKHYLYAAENISPKDKKSDKETELTIIGSGKYKLDGKVRAEDFAKENVLSKKDRTLSENQQRELLQNSGIDLTDYEPAKGKYGEICFKSKDGKTFYRVVNGDNQNKIICTTIDKKNASFNVFQAIGEIDEDEIPTDFTSKKEGINTEQFVDDMYNAMSGLKTDTEELEHILFDEKLSDEDFIEILKLYEEKYGLNSNSKKSLISKINEKTTGDFSIKIKNKMAERIINSANNGNEEALDLLVKEIYSSINNQTGIIDDFLNAIFNGLDDSVIVELDKHYSEIYTNQTLETDIKEKHKGFFGNQKEIPENQNLIIKKIHRAKRHFV